MWECAGIGKETASAGAVATVILVSVLAVYLSTDKEM
tara:strand:- start:269 stop:379 length:111 start_codon:yes stop_codon:yes gene_type:complete